MLARLRRRLTFANVTAALALFVALGGTSYAAIELPANSVGSEQIRSGAVGTSEIRASGVGRSEIATGAVRSGEIATGVVHGTEIASNSVGNVDMKKDAINSANVIDGSLEAADLSDAAKAALANAPVYRAAVNTTGAAVAGNATGATRASAGVYSVDFGHDVSGCFSNATIAAVKNGTGTDAPITGTISVEPGAASSSVIVRTATVPGGTPTDAPFHLVISC
jgi:hypothetical protein